MTTERDVASANQTLDWAHEVLGLGWTEVGRAVGADPRTIDRWRRGRSAPASEHWERIHDLRDLRFLLEVVLPDENARREWLRAPVPLLHGHSPISLIRAGRLEDVVGVLAGLESGAFA